MNGLTKAASDVLAERARQISAEGWTPEHDDAHGAGEMARAAATYAQAAAEQASGWDGPFVRCPTSWPWSPEWWKPKDCRRNLVRAAALLLAEIERLDRASSTAFDGVGVPSREVHPIAPTDGDTP